MLGVQCDMAVTRYKATPQSQDCRVKLIHTKQWDSLGEPVLTKDVNSESMGPCTFLINFSLIQGYSAMIFWSMMIVLIHMKSSWERPGWLKNNDNQPIYPNRATLQFQKHITEQSQNQAMNARNGKKHARELVPTIFKMLHPPNCILHHNEWKQQDYSIWKVTDVTAVQNNCLFLFFFSSAGKAPFL